jgi:hypothetical protein
MAKRLLALFILSFALTNASAQLVNDAEKVNAMKRGVTTPDDIKASFGEPEHVDKNPDGRFVHFYAFELKNQKNPNSPASKGKIIFLFDKDAKLIRYSLFEKDQ